MMERVKTLSRIAVRMTVAATLFLVLPQTSVGQAGPEGITEDRGDAPATYPVDLTYPVPTFHNVQPGYYLGGCIDLEGDGQPSFDAMGDDLNLGGPSGGLEGTCLDENGQPDSDSFDDEDGVFLLDPTGIPTDLTQCQTTAIRVYHTNTSGTIPTGFLFGWVDFNQDGDWDDGGEQVFGSVTNPAPLLASGWNDLSFDVPCSASPTDPTSEEDVTYMRFRLFSDNAGVPSDGSGSLPDGEMEDYAVDILRFVEPLQDWGDAIDAPAASPGYYTLAINNGANHAMLPGATGPFIGQCVDAEPDGQPNPPADGDDLGLPVPPDGVIGSCQVPGDDEDGVTFPPALLTGVTNQIQVDMTGSSSGCLLNAWIDGQADMDFDEPADRVLTDYPVAAGSVHMVPVFVPGSALPVPTTARVRCSTAGGDMPWGSAADGEVEDYVVFLEPGLSEIYDWGDAPDFTGGPTYQTISANNGAVHLIGPPTSPFMGSCVDAELDGQQSVLSDGDDLGAAVPPAAVVGTCVQGGPDDEDGVTLSSPLNPGGPAFIIVDMRSSPTSCQVNAWIDYGFDGTFDEPADRVLTDILLSAGTQHAIGIVIPANAVPAPTYSRFRCSTAGGDPPYGMAADGEVEDHLVLIEEPTVEEPNDWGDAPDTPGTAGYRTLSVNNGAVHGVTGPILGVMKDAEPDGLPHPLALGDDNTTSPDEDGIVTPPPHQLDLDAASPCVGLLSATGGQVDAWMDWDRSGTWDPDEYWSGPGGGSFTLLGADPKQMCFVLPGDEIAGPTFGRFRISANGVTPPLPYGYWPDGEVEDHRFILTRDVNLNLNNVWLEGPYLGGVMSTELNTSLPTAQPYGGPPWNHVGTETVSSMPGDVVDWLLIEARTQPGPGSTVHTQAVLLLDSGVVVDTSIVGPPVIPGVGTDSLYIVIRHRNHLDVMSSSKLDVQTGSASYDFSVAGAAFGVKPMKDLEQLPGPYGLFAGDGDPFDGSIQISDDFNLYLSEVIAGSTGYTPANYNLSASTEALDYNLYIANRAEGATSQVP